MSKNPILKEDEGSLDVSGVSQISPTLVGPLTAAMVKIASRFPRPMRCEYRAKEVVSRVSEKTREPCALWDYPSLI